MASIQKQFRISTQKHTNYEIIMEEYNSAMDVAKDCDNRPMTSSRFSSMRERDDWHWIGVKSYDDALNLLRNGYIEQVEAITKEINKTVKGQSKRITFHNDIVGYAPIVPLAILGVPNSMINSTIKPIKTKVINICYDMTCPAYVDQEDIIKVGTEFLKVIAGMEMQGYRINLTALQSYTGGQFANVLKVNLKSANQPLDLKRVSFPTMHTGFFRCIGFDWYSKTPKGKYLSGRGHSLTHEFSEGEMPQFKKQVLGDNVVYIAARKFVDDCDSKKLADMIREEIDNECKSNNS